MAKSIQILVVENSPGDAASLERELAGWGRCSVTRAQRLEEALSRLEKQRFDAVVMDAGLPAARGLECLGEIRNRVPREVPVVVLTRLRDEAGRAGPLQKGAEAAAGKAAAGASAEQLRAECARYAAERKRADEALRAAEQRLNLAEAGLAHLSRIGTLAQLAPGLAHELGQPLGAIVNYATACLGFAQCKSGSPADALAAIQGVLTEARRAAAIIRGMRSFIDKRQPSRTALDINELVRASMDMVEFEMRHQGIQPRLLLTGGLPKVLGDSVQIGQVLVNLLMNALEAISGNKSARSALTVNTALHDQGQCVQVCVIDTGTGICPEKMSRLFEPFFTTKPKGLGMGLNICRSIIESHGGQLTAARNPRRGMRFSFTVPVAE